MTTERADREVLKVSRLEIGELVGRIGYEGCWAKWTTLQPINGERARDVVPLLHPGDIVVSRDERSLGTSRLLCFIVHQTDVRRFALLWQGGEFLVSRIMGKGKNCFLSPTGGEKGATKRGREKGATKRRPQRSRLQRFFAAENFGIQGPTSRTNRCAVRKTDSEKQSKHKTYPHLWNPTPRNPHSHPAK